MDDYNMTLHVILLYTIASTVGLVAITIFVLFIKAILDERRADRELREWRDKMETAQIMRRR